MQILPVVFSDRLDYRYRERNEILIAVLDGKRKLSSWNLYEKRG